jgi:hypothetical protein
MERQTGKKTTYDGVDFALWRLIVMVTSSASVKYFGTKRLRVNNFCTKGSLKLLNIRGGLCSDCNVVECQTM